MTMNADKTVTAYFTTWELETVDDSTDIVGWYTSIALDSADRVHISYQNNSQVDLMYATNALGFWSYGTAESTGLVGIVTSIALDSSDKAHVTHYDATDDELLHSTNATGSWVSETIDSNGNAGGYSSIAIDPSDDMHVSYIDLAGDDLKYATTSGVSPGTGNCTDADWDCETVDSSTNNYQLTSIALDSGGWAHIVYYDSTDNDLEYATNASGSWALQTVDNNVNVGSNTSIGIAIDSSDNVHISYSDPSSGVLKYATNRDVSPGSGSCSNTNWDCETVGSAGSRYSSIALDSSDNVHISYIGGSWDLKYATNHEHGLGLRVRGQRRRCGRIYLHSHRLNRQYSHQLF
jgi:hypothetical protein